MLFDLDGTLVDTVATRLEAWLVAFDEFQIPARRDEVAGLIGSDGKRMARMVAESAGKPVTHQRADEIDRRAGEIYNGLNTDPRPLPGVRETLAGLDTRGITWAIATSSLEAQVRVSVEALRLPRRPMIVDGSHVEHAKPAPDLLIEASKRLRSAPERTWYAGDSVWDVQAANAASMWAIGVTTGFASKAQLEESGAAVVLDRLDRIVSMIP
ncbi:MAG TPA: HAD family hydrolase [Candidatus Dormibacteraeota bacterium]|nr:HAD family hydrolase [Candidatus Dormibacteraeota bacterium]